MSQDLHVPCYGPSGRCNLTAPCLNTCALSRAGAIPTVPDNTALTVPEPTRFYVSPVARFPDLATRSELEDRIEQQAAEIARLRALDAPQESVPELRAQLKTLGLWIAEALAVLDTVEPECSPEAELLTALIRRGEMLVLAALQRSKVT